MKERGDYKGTERDNKSSIKWYVEQRKTYDTVYSVRKKGTPLIRSKHCNRSQKGPEPQVRQKHKNNQTCTPVTSNIVVQESLPTSLATWQEYCPVLEASTE